MPKLTKAREGARILQVMQALQLIIRGATKQDACAEIGISTDVYDLWVSRETDAIEALQTNIAESERIRMAQIASAQQSILNSLISSVTGEHYIDHDLQLKVLKYLDNLREKLEDKHGVQSTTDKAEDYLLGGPNTREEESQMSVQHEMSRSTVNIKTKSDGSVDLEVPHDTTIIEQFPVLADESSSSEE